MQSIQQAIHVYISRFTLCGLLLFTPIVVVGQTAEERELIRTLLERVQQLEKRVSELEQEKQTKAAAATDAPPLSAPSQQPPPVSEPKYDIADLSPITAEQQVYPKFRMAGFSDVNFSGSTAPGSTSGFNSGQFVLHITSQLSPKVSFFSELTLTRSAEGTHDHPAEPGFAAEVERSLIRYDYNDQWKLSFGRYHTPVNFWNTAFHHGTWLQTTASRPEMARSFIPIHFVGALSEGSLPANGLNLTYNIGLGNGRGATLQRAGDSGDLNNHRAWLATVFARPDKVYALQVGASVYRDEVGDRFGQRTSEWMQGVHLVWHREDPELIAEFANASHRTVGTSEAVNSQAWYVQTAYRIPETKWKPYYRFEYQHIPKADLVFQSVPSLAGSVAGLRWDISAFAAFKFEYRNFRRSGTERTQSGFIQTSFTF